MPAVAADAQSKLRVNARTAGRQSSPASSNSRETAMPLFHNPAVRSNSFPHRTLTRHLSRAVEALEGRLMLDATVTLSASGPSTVKFVDADGSNSSIKLGGPGTVTVLFGGDGLTQTTKGKKTVNLTGTPTSVSAAATGATTKTSITIKGSKGANKRADIANIGVIGSLSKLTAKAAALAGNLNISGAANSITLGSDTSGTVSAQSIKKMTVTDAFNTNLTTGALGTFKAGTIGGGTWTVGGEDTSVTANSTNGWVGNFGSIKKLAVKGALTNSTVRVGGNIHSMQAGDLTGSNVYAGLANLAAGTLPSAPGDFTASSSIDSIKLKTLSAGSNIAAATIGKATLGTVQTVGVGSPFGVGATQISNLTATVSGKKLKLKNVDAQSQVDAALAALAIPPQSFVIRIV
jgi:hypothetical protein